MHTTTITTTIIMDMHCTYANTISKSLINYSSTVTLVIRFVFGENLSELTKSFRKVLFMLKPRLGKEDKRPKYS